MSLQSLADQVIHGSLVVEAYAAVAPLVFHYDRAAARLAADVAAGRRNAPS